MESWKLLAGSRLAIKIDNPWGLWREVKRRRYFLALENGIFYYQSAAEEIKKCENEMKQNKPSEGEKWGDEKRSWKFRLYLQLWPIHRPIDKRLNARFYRFLATNGKIRKEKKKSYHHENRYHIQTSVSRSLGEKPFVPFSLWFLSHL